MLMQYQIEIAERAMLCFLEVGGDPVLLRTYIDDRLNLMLHKHHDGLALKDTGMHDPLLGALARNNVHDLLTLLRHTRNEIRCMPGIGDTRAYQIEAALARHGLRLREGPIDAECV